MNGMELAYTYVYIYILVHIYIYIHTYIHAGIHMHIHIYPSGFTSGGGYMLYMPALVVFFRREQFTLDTARSET